ncbi:cyclic nucleotide-binding-like protein [Pavlovales sp. CCMP2436]|nr:cyclic nucleotide-binding-like protein [Pavlovales sp. CCMP2436]
MLCSMLEAMCIERPGNPHQFVVDWMYNNHPGSVKLAAGNAPIALTIVEPDEEEEEEDAYHETEERPPTGAPDMSLQMAMSLNRNKVSRRRAAVSAESVNPAEILSSYERKVHAKPADVRAKLKAKVASNFLFSGLDAEQLETLLDAMFEASFAPGATVIEQGAEGDNFYVIYAGECDVFLSKAGVQSKVLHCVEGDSFGELALLYNAKRAATVKAASACSLYAVDRNTFKFLMMDTTVTKRRTYEGFLEKVPLLASLTSNERQTVADALKPIHYKDGEVIIRQHEVGDTFYILEKGTVGCTNELKENIGSCKKGDYFGEIALLTNRPRAATVTAEGEVTALALDRRTFTRVLGPLTDVLKRNMAVYNKFMAHNI